MGLQDILPLFETVVCGRLCLSILPPGWPGNHDLREGGAMLCASWLLGVGALALVPWRLPWIALLLFRVALLPAGLRPRYEYESDARPVWFALFIVCVVSGGLGGEWSCGAAILLGALFMATGWSTWKRRADRRARVLGPLCLAAAALSCWLA